MSKNRLMILALMVAVAASGLVLRGDARQVEADATSLAFSPSAIALEGSGASTTVDLFVSGLGIGEADTVQVNIQHTSQFTISSPQCGAMYPTGSVSAAAATADGTVFTCAQQDGPVSGSGVVASFTITKNDDVKGEAVLTLLATGPFRTTFFEAGTEVGPGTLGSLSVWDLLDPIGNESVNENATLTPVAVNATTDGAVPTLSATVNGGSDISGFPWMTFTDNLDTTGTFEASPGFDDGGVYTIEVHADNGTVVGTETFTLTVNEVNRPPVLDPIGPQSVAEDGTLPFPLTATDPDGDTLTFSATVDAVGVPTGFTTLTPTGAGTATLSFAPGFDDEGTYSVVVTVTDDNGAGALDDSETFTLTVTNTNRQPTVDFIFDQNVDEGGSLPVPISGSDPDGDSITLSATIDGNPLDFGFSTISATVADAATLSFNPAMGEDGTYTVVVTATDGELATGTATFTLTVNDVGSVTAPADTVKLQGLPNRAAEEAQHDNQFNAIAPLVELVRVSDSQVEASMLVAADGSFGFNDVPKVEYELHVSAAGYLTHVLTGVDLTIGDFDLGPSGANAPVLMLGGLVVPGNDVVAGDDLSAVLGAFGMESIVDRLVAGDIVDINGDGSVTGQDVSTVISNLGLSGDQPWL